eukprot:7255447-Alexandrium_andersonii.AAC.1
MSSLTNLCDLIANNANGLKALAWLPLRTMDAALEALSIGVTLPGAVCALACESVLGIVVRQAHGEQHLGRLVEEGLAFIVEQ